MTSVPVQYRNRHLLTEIVTERKPLRATRTNAVFVVNDPLSDLN
jgi:hypothetical protein